VRSPKGEAADQSRMASSACEEGVAAAA